MSATISSQTGLRLLVITGLQATFLYLMLLQTSAYGSFSQKLFESSELKPDSSSELRRPSLCTDGTHLMAAPRRADIPPLPSRRARAPVAVGRAFLFPAPLSVLLFAILNLSLLSGNFGFLGLGPFCQSDVH